MREHRHMALTGVSDELRSTRKFFSFCPADSRAGKFRAPWRSKIDVMGLSDRNTYSNNNLQLISDIASPFRLLYMHHNSTSTRTHQAIDRRYQKYIRILGRVHLSNSNLQDQADLHATCFLQSPPSFFAIRAIRAESFLNLEIHMSS